MSHDATTLAWDRIRDSNLSATRRLVLLALADRHNAKTGKCNPSIKRLIGDTKLDRKTVLIAIQELEDGGFIAVQRMNGAGSHYFLGALQGYAAVGACKAMPNIGTGPNNGTSPKFGHEPVPKTGHEPGIELKAIHTLGAHKETIPLVPSKPVLQDITIPAKPKLWKSAKTPLPENFTASDSVQEWYAAKGYSERLEDHVEAFRDKAAARGYAYANWDAALKTAVRDDWAGLRTKKIPAALRRAPGHSSTNDASRYYGTERQRIRQRNSDTIAMLARGEYAGGEALPPNGGGIHEPLDAIDGESRAVDSGVH